MSARRYHRSLPQSLHVMPRGHSVTRLCGATTGGFVREREQDWLRKFLADGGGLCPQCKKLLDTNGEAE